MSVTTLGRFARLCKEIDDLEESVKAAKAKRDLLEPEVVAHMERHGIQNVNVEGRCIYLKREMYASVNADAEGALERLKRYGPTRPLVKESVNGNSLSSWVRELDQDAEGKPILPSEVDGCITIRDGFRARARKA